MRKKTPRKSSAEKGKARRKLLDLPVKAVKGGEATSVKGGSVTKPDDTL